MLPLNYHSEYMALVTRQLQMAKLQQQKGDFLYGANRVVLHVDVPNGGPPVRHPNSGKETGK